MKKLVTIGTVLVVLLSASVALAGSNDQPEKVDYSIQLLTEGSAAQPATHHTISLGSPIYLKTTVGENHDKGLPQQVVTFNVVPEVKDGKVTLVGVMAGQSGGVETRQVVDIDEDIESGKAASFPLEIDGVHYDLLLKVSY